MKKIVKNAISLTRQLVKIPSESSNPLQTNSSSPEAGVVDLLGRVCNENNIWWKRQEALPGRYNFVAHFPKPNAPKLLLTAHMDTVSAKGMKNPFDAKIKDDKIWGRGTCDDKGSLAVAMSSLLGLTRKQKPLHYDVTVLGTVDEECSMSGAAQFAKEAGDFDLCIALEATGLKVINAHKGVYRCQVKTRGKAAHSSNPDLGSNAILSMHSIITDILRFGDKLKKNPHPELGEATLAITQLNGGTVINIIPDQCTMSVDVRLLPRHSPKKIAKSLKELIGDRGSIRKIFAAKALHTPLDNKHIEKFFSTLELTGFSTSPTTASYATDCSKLNQNGPCIVWGPGSIDQAHQVDEFIEIDQIEKACKVFIHFLSK